jgi:hypothetical protein
MKRNITLMFRIVKVQEEDHGIPRGHMFRPQGPHPVEDTFGMMTAVVLLDHSLNAGINAVTVQFNTVRKTRSVMSNYEGTPAPEMRHAALAGYKKGESLGFANTSVYSLWFDRFIVGCHVQMGDDTRQDTAFSIELILAMQKLLEEDLLKCQTMEAMINVSLHGIFFIAGFCGGLRGEEMPLLSLDATAKYLLVAQPRSPELANICLALRGIVKGDALEEACHLVPIAAITASGLTPRLWVRRAVEDYANLGITNGWMFRNKEGEAERMGVYEPYMFELIQRVQDAGVVAERLLPREEDITESHGIVRSGRRGYAIHATNVGIADAGINRLDRWRAIEAAAGRAASLPGGTTEGYSEINQLIKSLLRASRPL